MGIFLSFVYFVTYLFQPQRFDYYITSDLYFPSRLELFQAIMQDFQQCFNLSHTNRRDQGFFVHRQLISFFFCLLRRIVSGVIFLGRGRLRSSDFASKILLGLTYFMRKSKCRHFIFRAAKSTVGMERQKSKKRVCTNAMISAVIDVT